MATTVRMTTAVQRSVSGRAYGRSAPKPDGPCPCDSLTSGIRRRIDTSRTSAGTASSGVHLTPTYCAYGANSIGAIALPIAPPVTCTDIAVPRRAPPTRFTMAAAVG